MSVLLKLTLSHSKIWNLWKKGEGLDWQVMFSPGDAQLLKAALQATCLTVNRERRRNDAAVCFEKLVPCIDHFTPTDAQLTADARQLVWALAKGIGCEVAENQTRPAVGLCRFESEEFFFFTLPKWVCWEKHEDKKCVCQCWRCCTAVVVVVAVVVSRAVWAVHPLLCA